MIISQLFAIIIDIWCHINNEPCHGVRKISRLYMHPQYRHRHKHTASIFSTALNLNFEWMCFGVRVSGIWFCHFYDKCMHKHRRNVNLMCLAICSITNSFTLEAISWSLFFLFAVRCHCAMLYFLIDSYLFGCCIQHTATICDKRANVKRKEIRAKSVRTTTNPTWIIIIIIIIVMCCCYFKK